MKILLLITLLCLVNIESASATKVDTLTAFSKKSALHHYRIRGVKMQAARFESYTTGSVIRLSLLLGGLADSGTARVRLFGNEAGAPVPLLQEDLIEPITIHKTRRGIETCLVVLQNPVRISSHQFFVAVDQLSDGVTLVTDTERKQPFCHDQGGEFAYQCLLMPDKRWCTGPYAFGISVHLEYDAKQVRSMLQDVTSKVGLPDTAAGNSCIAWADYNGDSRLDLLSGGHLYRNDDGRFVDVTNAVGLQGVPRANLFLDINSDGRLDILFLGSADLGRSVSPSLFIAGADSVFHQRLLPDISVHAPTSFSVADVDADGYVDLFVGQGTDSLGLSRHNLLLVNDRHDGFVDRSSALLPEGYAPRASQGSQWVDINSDGFPDLFVANHGRDECELWRNNGDGSFSMLYGPKGFAPVQMHSVNAVGGHWRDSDGDAKADLLLPQKTWLATLSDDRHDRETLLRLTDTSATLYKTISEENGVPYSEMRGSATWGDIDNDGLLDIMMSSGSECRYVDIYKQRRDRHFEPATAECGLLGISAGPEAVWVDYNNDGNIDLCTFVNGRVRLFENVAETPGNYIAVDIMGPYRTGAKVEVYAGDQRYTTEIISGRGLLAQDPSRLHFGLGSATIVDSLLVRWSNGIVDRQTRVSVNTLTTVTRDFPTADIGRRAIANAGAFPNPFSESVELFYELAIAGSVTVQVFTTNGTLVWEQLLRSVDVGVHSVNWNGRDIKGNRVAQGSYLYRIRSGQDERTGRITMVK